jgi:SP family general alpha glucoside:H+ symporter-like MFS transporter
MESFDMFLNGNFVALPRFAEKYGIETSPGVYSIQTKWQSALFQSGQCGAFVGVFLAGPVTTRLGYRWTTILALMLMNATIFVSFFVSSSPQPPTVIIILTISSPRLGQLTRCSYGRPIP